MALASAGNLSVSQSVVSTLTEGIDQPRDRRDRHAAQRADHVPGGAAHRPRDPPGSRPRGTGAEAADRRSTSRSCSAAQIKGDRLRLFMIYPAGNSIECTVDTPYLQIGEHKYGKPVLDRAITYGIDLYDGAQDRPDLDGLHHALESRRRHAARRAGRASAANSTPTSTTGSARPSPISTTCATLVEGAARRIGGYPGADVQERARPQARADDPHRHRSRGRGRAPTARRRRA